MRTAFVAACLLLVSWFIATPGQAGAPPAQHTAPSVHEGEQLFIKRCLQCHSVNEGETRFGPSLYGEMKGSHPKKTSSQIRTLLKDGKGKMPPSPDLTQEDTDNLLAYLRTL